MTNWYAEGMKLGKYAESLEEGTNSAEPVNDRIHHIGDDTGDLITRAYRTDGLSAATEVLTGYFDEFNANRTAHNRAALSPEHAAGNLVWAFKPQGLNVGEQEEVSRAFRKLRP